MLLGSFAPFRPVRLSASESHVLISDTRSQDALLLDRKANVLKTLAIPGAEEEGAEWSACLGPGVAQLWVFRASKAIIERFRFR